MTRHEPLAAAALYRPCDPADVPFETTEHAAELTDVVGQARAAEAVRFGIGVRREGYNLFAIGPAGVGKQTLLRQLLARRAAEVPASSDWCLVHSFAEPRRPRALSLPPGRGPKLRADMQRVVGELRVGLGSAFDSEGYRTRKRQILERFKQKQEKAFEEAQESAKERGIAILRTETGVVLAPLRNDAVLDPAAFKRLPEETRAEIQAQIEQVGADLEQLFQRFHEWAHEHHDEIAAADRETAATATRRVMESVYPWYEDLPQVLAYLADVEKDVVSHADEFLESPGDTMEATVRRALRADSDGPTIRRYQVNVLVSHAPEAGAPVVYEDNPTYPNLVGRIEHVSQLGTLLTDFTLIKPGALHRARGGYLLLDALRLLQSPFAWEALKRILRAGEIRIESIAELLGVVSTESLEPEPVPLGDTKVVLFGERVLYYLLASYDPSFLELFKVLVDFEDTMERSRETHSTYASLLGTLVRREELLPMDREAVARVVEHAARLAGDAEKLSVHMRPIVDLLREADHQAASAGRDRVGPADVQAAIDARIRRAGRLQEQLLDAFRRRTIELRTSGEHVGQVNGLSVLQLGEHAFGHPTRITARVRLGRGELVDIEREVALGGPIHSKGVLILAGFLGARYASGVPLSLSASLVFEQSYSSVEGDSASVAETCALLSALADVPILQSLSVTGSMDQHGHVQAIGGVNEKIEGFFDVCRERGLDGTQGVLIPRSNVQHLMLRRDVVEAVEQGRFAVYPVAEVDEALELLTGREAGARDAHGRFPPASLNAMVEAQLVRFAEQARAFATGGRR